MNKYFILVLLSLLSLSFLSVSCGDDDNDLKELPREKATLLPGVYGHQNKRISEWNGIEFFYYDNGGIDSVATPRYLMDGRMKFSSDQTSRWVYDNYHSYRDFSSKISFNSQGYITVISSVSQEYDADAAVGSQLFNYDNKGHLFQVGYKSNDGVFHGSMAIVWENDTIVRIDHSGVDTGETLTNGYTFEYGGGKYKNETLQYDGSLLGTWHNRDLQALFILGYFGKGPAFLPTKCVYHRIGLKDTEYTFTYEFNTDATISKGYGELPSQGAYYTYE